MLKDTKDSQKPQQSNVQIVCMICWVRYLTDLFPSATIHIDCRSIFRSEWYRELIWDPFKQGHNLWVKARNQ